MRQLQIPWVQEAKIFDPVCNGTNAIKTELNHVTPSRGRPRKSALSGSGGAASGNSASERKDPRFLVAFNGEDSGSIISAKRPRGRPPKRELDLGDLEMATMDMPQKRARGRPRKSV